MRDALAISMNCNAALGTLVRGARQFRKLCIPLLSTCIALVAPAQLWAAPLDFSEQIKPILSDRCFMCHGPDNERREADLRLDKRQSAVRETSDGLGTHVIKPGDPDASGVYLRVTSDDESLRMPPVDSKLSLNDHEIALIRQWIAEGANWNEHWAFTPVERPAVPHNPTPAEWPRAATDNVGQSSSAAGNRWERNEVDAFVLARMLPQQLLPADEASRDVLIRRLSFDLRGVPPTLAEIDAFLADSRSDAYEQLVDRLLDSEQYGERMASEWLDVARYSDTYGYQVDRDRFVWPWRDWVIRAYNANMPFDQFVTQQIAGDLLPDATQDQILATTFCRLHPQKVEGGSVPEEFRVEYVADRNQTFATAFLGLTMECARCHDHKYDPFTQKNYYQLSSFFDNIDEAGLYSYFTDAIPSPSLLLTDDATAEKLRLAGDDVAAAEKRLAQVAVDRCKEYQRWLQPRSPSTGDGDTHENDGKELIPNRLVTLTFDDFEEGANVKVPGKFGSAVKLTGDDVVNLEVGNFRRCEPFSVSLWMNTPDTKERAVIFHRSRAWTDAASRGYELLLEDGKLSAALIHFWPGNAIRVVARDPLPVGQWAHVVMTYDGSSRAGGLRLYVDGKSIEVEIVRDHLFKNITGGGGDNLAIGERFRDHGFTQGLVDEFSVFHRELTPLECAQLADGHALTDAIAAVQPSVHGETGGETPHDAKQTAENLAVYGYYLSTADEQYRAARAELQEKRAAYNAIADGIPEIMAMREMESRRPTYVLKRGAYDARGEQVAPETPEFLPPFPDDQPRNRLGLAHWLTDPRHPLTARVAVNRYWQIVFGTGLVRTPEDFGSQGRPPTHPLLLDWLADDFMRHGWDVKRLIKQLVSSATYRQSSLAGAAKLAADPENQWLSYAPSYRLPAEMLRDNVLAASGLMVNRVGGVPSRPYELAYAYDPSQPDEGDGVYRRSLYTYWKGSGPAPVMMTLDASKRDVCRMRRERTSSPLQALVLLNGPQFVEAARALSAKAIELHGDDDRAVLTYLFRSLTSRLPSPTQLDAVVKLYAEQREEFQQDTAARDAYLSNGRFVANAQLDRDRLAAIAVVANTLFNYDGCVTKR